jgi:hypothetical protein
VVRALAVLLLIWIAFAVWASGNLDRVLAELRRLGRAIVRWMRGRG